MGEPRGTQINIFAMFNNPHQGLPEDRPTHITGRRDDPPPETKPGGPSYWPVR